MKRTRFFLIGIVTFLIIASGCSKVINSEDKCKSSSDCPDKKCMNKGCEDKRCSYTPIPDCCGNGIKDAIEDNMLGSKCSCPEDYGPCSGSVNEYLGYGCSEDLSCTMEVKKDLLTLLTKTNSVDVDKISLGIVSTYNQPFNLKKDTIDMEISVKSKSDTINDFKVKKITAMMKEKNREVKLGEKEVGRYLWGVGDKINEHIILNFLTEKDSETLKNLIFRVDYGYVKSSKTRDTASEISDYFTFGYGRSEFIYINPPIDYSCPPSCDDNDPATEDYCSEETNFFCYNKFIPQMCGNQICEKGENKCTCSSDCGRCEGDYKRYMKWQCFHNQCLTTAKEKPQNISVLEEKNFDGFHISLKYNYDVPFDAHSSKFNIEMKYLRMDKQFSYFAVKRVNILEEDILLGSAEERVRIGTYPKNVSTISIPMSFELEEDEEASKDITVKIYYYYSNEEGDGEKTYSKKFDGFRFFNPGYP